MVPWHLRKEIWCRVLCSPSLTTSRKKIPAGFLRPSGRPQSQEQQTQTAREVGLRPMGRPQTRLRVPLLLASPLASQPRRSVSNSARGPGAQAPHARVWSPGDPPGVGCLSTHCHQEDLPSNPKKDRSAHQSQLCITPHPSSQLSY